MSTFELSRRKRLGCVLGIVGLFAVVSAACGRGGSATGPSQTSSAEKRLSKPVGHHHHREDDDHDFRGGGNNGGGDKKQEDERQEREHANLRDLRKIGLAFVTGSSGAKHSVTLYSVLMIGAVGGFMHTLGGGRRRK